MNTQFVKWSDAEEQQLLKEVQEGLLISAIAKVHNRSKKAIEIRLQDISIRMVDNGCTYDEVFEKTKCTEEQIKNRLKQVEVEKAQKTPKNSSQIPFRQLLTPDHTTIDTILAEIRELKILIADKQQYNN